MSYAEIERLKTSKPKNSFKIEVWQAELDKKVELYNKIKLSFDDLKDQGLTAEFIQAAHAEQHHGNPMEYNNIKAMEDEVVAYDEEQVKVLREQRQQQGSRVDKGIDH